MNPTIGITTIRENQFSLDGCEVILRDEHAMLKLLINSYAEFFMYGNPKNESNIEYRKTIAALLSLRTGYVKKNIYDGSYMIILDEELIMQFNSMDSMQTYRVPLDFADKIIIPFQ